MVLSPMASGLGKKEAGMGIQSSSGNPYIKTTEYKFDRCPQRMIGSEYEEIFVSRILGRPWRAVSARDGGGTELSSG